MAEIACPRCNNSVQELQSLDAAIIVKLRESGKETENIPPQVCSNCFNELAGSIARGSILVAREKAKEQRKAQLWKSRVNLIKNARKCMGQKAFSEAAVQYEKYLRVIEMVFEVKPGELKPDQFKDSARTQEITVVASAYWDLVRIYDTSNQYGDRQMMVAMKLAQFLRYTPIYPDVMKKAEAFQKTARNPAAVKMLIKMASENKGKCFIASSAFESVVAPEVLLLQRWRDEKLLNYSWGPGFVGVYYFVSPVIARVLDETALGRRVVRQIIRRVLRNKIASLKSSQ